MKLTVLVDNNTFIDEYYFAEPAVCYYIEDTSADGTTRKILFDTGYTDIFMKNAELMGIDLADVSTIVLSHGHDDHTRGLQYFCERFDSEKVTLLAHPDAIKPKYMDNLPIGVPFSPETLALRYKLSLSKEPVALTEKLVFLGEIPEVYAFEKRAGMGTIQDACARETGDAVPADKIHDLVASERADLLFDDTALAYRSERGLFIITGCSHSGICNIIEHAKKVCGDDRIVGVIGGFHLFGVTPRLTETIRYFSENRIAELYPCHCVDFRARAEIDKTIPIHEVGVGMRLELV